MSLQVGRDDYSLKKALDDRYDQKQKSFETWAQVHPVVQQVNAEAALKVQREWCKTAEVTGTPTVFINGRRLPQNYQPKDIRLYNTSAKYYFANNDLSVFGKENN